MSSSVANVVRTTALREGSARIASKDKSDRATVEQAIDPRTRMVGMMMILLIISLLLVAVLCSSV